MRVAWHGRKMGRVAKLVACGSAGPMSRHRRWDRHLLFRKGVRIGA